ncbi:MAG: hypothetical protein WKF29_02295 [Thermoleophilaceae bacterium]
MRAARSRAGFASTVLVAATLGAAAGCGGGEDAGRESQASGQAAGAQPVGKESAGSVTQFANCDNWRAGSPAERRATVVELRRQLTPQEAEEAKSPLADDRAYEILQKACAPSFAGSLRLYKLYVRAQGFAPLND